MFYKWAQYWHNWFEWWVSGDTGTHGFMMVLRLESIHEPIHSGIVRHPGQRHPQG